MVGQPPLVYSRLGFTTDPARDAAPSVAMLGHGSGPHTLNGHGMTADELARP